MAEDPNFTQAEIDTDTALHEDILGRDLDRPLPEEVLEKHRDLAGRLNVPEEIVER